MVRVIGNLVHLEIFLRHHQSLWRKKWMIITLPGLNLENPHTPKVMKTKKKKDTIDEKDTETFDHTSKYFDENYYNEY